MTRVVGATRLAVRGVALSETGVPVRGATITVTDAATGNAVDIFSDAALSTPLSSLVADANGVYQFFVPDGTYNLAASGLARMQSIEPVTVSTGLGTVSPPSAAAQIAGRLLLVDNFQRPNRNIRGDRAQSGQPWMFVSGGGASDANIVNGRLVFTSPTDSPPTIYGRLGEEIGEVAASVIIHADGNGTQQAIIGATPTVFGGIAIQLGWSAVKSNWGTVDGLTHHWCLFGSGGGGAGKIAFGDFSADLQPGAHYWSMRRIDQTTLLLSLPNGQTVLVTDATIPAAWGPVAAFQQRRITTAAGTMDFVSVAAAARAQIPPLAAPVGATGLTLPGAAAPAVTGVEALIPLPTASQDLDIRIKFKLAAIATTYDILTLRSTRSGGVVPSLTAWRLFATSASLLDLGVSVDGTTVVLKGTTFAALGIAANAWSVIKVTRLAADGTIRMYSSVDEGANWTLNGGVLSGAPSGPLAASLEPVRIGSLDITNAGQLAGAVAWAEIRDGLDGPLLGRWSPGMQVDAQGNTWWLTGTQWAWS